MRVAELTLAGCDGTDIEEYFKINKIEKGEMEIWGVNTNYFFRSVYEFVCQ